MSFNIRCGRLMHLGIIMFYRRTSTCLWSLHASSHRCCQLFQQEQMSPFPWFSQSFSLSTPLRILYNEASHANRTGSHGFAMRTSAAVAWPTCRARKSEKMVAKRACLHSSKGANLVAGAEHAQHGALEARRSRLLLLPRWGQALPGLLGPLIGQKICYALEGQKHPLQAQLSIVLQRTCRSRVIDMPLWQILLQSVGIEILLNMEQTLLQSVCQGADLL